MRFVKCAMFSGKFHREASIMGGEKSSIFDEIEDYISQLKARIRSRIKMIERSQKDGFQPSDAAVSLDALGKILCDAGQFLQVVAMEVGPLLSTKRKVVSFLLQVAKKVLQAVRIKFGFLTQLGLRLVLNLVVKVCFKGWK